MSEANLECRQSGCPIADCQLQSPLGREAKSLMGYTLSFPCGRRPLKQNKQTKPSKIRFSFPLCPHFIKLRKLPKKEHIMESQIGNFELQDGER